MSARTNDVPGWAHLRRWALEWLLHAPGIKVGSSVRLDRSHPELGGLLTLGRNIEIGAGSCLDLSGGIEIGDAVTLSEGVRLFSHDHLVGNRHRHWREQGIRGSTLKIEAGAWIGAGAIVLNSARVVGEGAIVGAGAIVTAPVPPWSIAVGNPARVVKVRDEPDREVSNDP